MTRLFSDRLTERSKEKRREWPFLTKAYRDGDAEEYASALISSENVTSRFLLISLSLAPVLSIQLDIYLITLTIGTDEGCIATDQKSRRQHSSFEGVSHG